MLALYSFLLGILCFVNVRAFQRHQNFATRGNIRLWNKTPLVAGGKRVEADPGSSMLAACQKLGLKVPLDCRKGDCGTCTVTVGGSKIRACVGKVPPAPRLKSLIEKGLAVTVDNK